MFASRKRGRDENEDDLMSFAHEPKKSCALPFRILANPKATCSPSSRHRPAPLFTQTITPTDSEDEGSPLRSASKQQYLQPSPQTNLNLDLPLSQSPDIDMDMDMNDSIVPAFAQYTPMPSPKASPCTLTPPVPAFKDPFRASQNAVFGGRIPTPIYGHFQQAIDARMDMDEDGGSSIQRSQQEIEYENYVRRRRLPTPIDEDEPMDVSIGMTGGIPTSSATGNTSDYVPISAKTSHSFAAPPRGTRLSFSMGIRADCEMCKNRVPGHSNHIIRTIYC